jgi:hypothetical protein
LRIYATDEPTIGVTLSQVPEIQLKILGNNADQTLPRRWLSGQISLAPLLRVRQMTSCHWG